MAHRAPIARAFTDLNVAVMTDYGAVTPEFKRLLGYVSSFASGCLYCQAHMILASERFGASEDRLNDVFDFEGSAHFTEAEKAALAFAQAATAVPNAVTSEVGERLRAHWPPEAIVEIMGVVALFGYLNRWNDSMGSALEDLPIEKGRGASRRGDGLERGQAPMSELAGHVRAALAGHGPAPAGRAVRPHGPVQRAVPAGGGAACRPGAETLSQRARPRGARTARAAACGLPGMPANGRGSRYRRPNSSCSRITASCGPSSCRRPCRTVMPSVKCDDRSETASACGPGKRRDGDLRVLVRGGPAAGAYRTACLGAQLRDRRGRGASCSSTRFRP
jgi:alkylhydroperoxidase family enzyme